MSASAIYYPSQWMPPGQTPQTAQGLANAASPPLSSVSMPEASGTQNDQYTPSHDKAQGSEAGASAFTERPKPKNITIKIPKGLPLLTSLQPGQEIAPEQREKLNPMQRFGVWMIENCYQRLALKQNIYKQISDSGYDVCAYARRDKDKHPEGPDNQEYQSCSQYTKMAIVRDGFFKGCFEGGVRVMSCNPILFNHGGDWGDRFIERHAAIRPDEPR